MNLKDKELFIFDLDGTVYNEGILFDGSLDLLNEIKRLGKRYIFLSNNSSRSLSEYVKKLTNMGISCNEDDFYISTQAMALFLKKNHPNQLIYVQGTTAMIDQLRSDGINVTTNVDLNAKAVVIGFDTELTFLKLTNTIKMLNMNLPYYGCNEDLVCPVNYGFVPDCGSMAISLYNATKKKPKYVGKPNKEIVETVLEKLNISKDKAILIGDRLYTDIACAINANIDSICVLNGESSLEDIENSIYKPTLVYKSVKEIYLDLIK